MPPPLRNDDLTRVALYLAEQQAAKKGKPLPEHVKRKVYARFPGEGTATGSVDVLETDGSGGYSSTTTTPAQIPKLRELGHDWVGQGEYNDLLQSVNPTQAPPGKIPFISGTPTHPAAPGYSAEPTAARDPRMTDAMAAAASAFRQRPPPEAPPQSPAPAAPAPKKIGTASGKRSLDVRLSSSTGATPDLRPFQPLAQLAPDEAEQRLEGLPEGVAKIMRERWGLADAQDAANRHAMGVEIAAAGDQIASGFTRTKYEDGNWDHLRTAAHQPVADYQARSAEERLTNEDTRREAEDERHAREAEQAARMELEKFEYGKGRDKSQDQLARDRMGQEERLAEARLRADAADRGQRREEMHFRQKEGLELKQQMAKDKEEERQRREHEKDLQRLGEQTGKAPYGEFQQQLQEVDRLIPGLPYGKVPDEAPLSLGDRAARALAPVGGEFFMSDKGKAYATAIANLRDLVSRMRSGAVLNASEEQHYMGLLGDRALSDERSAAMGINAVRQGIGQKLRNAQAPYVSTGALDDYEKTGATSFRAPIFSDTGRRVPVVSPEGKPGTLDESELAEALKHGWRTR